MKAFCPLQTDKLFSCQIIKFQSNNLSAICYKGVRHLYLWGHKAFPRKLEGFLVLNKPTSVAQVPFGDPAETKKVKKVEQQRHFEFAIRFFIQSKYKLFATSAILIGSKLKPWAASGNSAR